MYYEWEWRNIIHPVRKFNRQLELEHYIKGNNPRIKQVLQAQLQNFPPVSHPGFYRPYRVEHRECPEVAAVDWTSVQAAPRRKGLPGLDRKGFVCHERGGVSPALATVRRHVTCASGYMEVRCVFQMRSKPWNNKRYIIKFKLSMVSVCSCLDEREVFSWRYESPK